MKTLNSPQAGCRSLWNQMSEICVCKFRLTSGYNLWLTATKIMWLRKSPLGHCHYNRFRLMFQSNWNSLKVFSLFYHCTLDRQPVHRRLWKPTFQNNCCRLYIDIRISACIISIKALGFFSCSEEQMSQNINWAKRCDTPPLNSSIKPPDVLCNR